MREQKDDKNKALKKLHEKKFSNKITVRIVWSIFPWAGKPERANGCMNK
jgi:hypothetical protein